MPYCRRNLLVVLAAVMCGCAKEVPVVEVKGECADVFQAQLCTWARMQGQTVLEAGADVPVAGIENAPKDSEMAWPPVPLATLKLPDPAQQQTGLTQLTMLWESRGHPPSAFLTPHFDFHFYTISPAEQSAIDCADASKPSVLPAAYSLPDLTLPPPMAKALGVSTLVGICVPRMGMHALLTAELESTNPLRGSMVIGYYHGKPIFIEPMVARSMLLEKRSFDLPVPVIPGMTGGYPRAFRATYDAQRQVYRFVFSDFAPGT